MSVFTLPRHEDFSWRCQLFVSVGQFGKKKGGKAGVEGDEILKIKYAHLPCVSADTPSE